MSSPSSTPDSTLDQLQTVFRSVFGDDEISLRKEMTADDIDGWDSLAHINLIIAVEKHFKIRFATAEISGLKEEGQNVGTFAALIAKKVEGRK
jgi:acyl carrier protein